MTSKKTFLILTALLLGGCLSSSGAGLDASSDTGRARQRSDNDRVKTRQVCETTSIAGEPKSFCY